MVARLAHRWASGRVGSVVPEREVRVMIEALFTLGYTETEIENDMDGPDREPGEWPRHTLQRMRKKLADSRRGREVGDILTDMRKRREQQ